MAFDLSTINDLLIERTSPLIFRAMKKSKTLGLMNQFPGLKSKQFIPLEDMDYDIQQAGGTCAFTAKGDIIISQQDLDPKQVELMMEFCVKKLERTFWNQALPKGSFYDDLEPREARFLELILKAVSESLEMSVWHGEEGGASPIGSFNLYDGIIHTIDDEIAAGTIAAAQRVLTGVINSGNVIAAFEDMRDSMIAEIFDDVSEESDWVALCSGETRTTYARAYRSSFNSLTPSARTLDNFVNGNLSAPLFIDGTNIQIVAVPGLTGTIEKDKIVLTKKSNMWWGFDVEGEESNLRTGMDEFEKNVWVQSDWKFAFNFGKPEELVVNNFS